MMQQTFIICCSLIFISYSAYAEQQRILHDPFAKPLLQKPPNSGQNKLNSNPKPAPWSPILSSTLRAGKNSMVIVSGQVIKLDEEIEGYQLIKVDERSAVFIKNRKKIHLTLGDNE